MLSIGVDLYKPGDPAGIVMAKFLTIPLLSGIAKAIDNFRKHI